MAKVLKAANVDFAILGPEEGCTGDAPRRAGNEYLYWMCATQNVELLAESLLSRFQALEKGDTAAVMRARSHVYLSTIASRRGQPQQACDEVAQAFPLLDADRVDHLRTQADALTARGACRRLLGDTAGAESDYATALAMFSRQDVGDDVSLAAAHTNLAALRHHQGRNVDARSETASAKSATHPV